MLRGIWGVGFEEFYELVVVKLGFSVLFWFGFKVFKMGSGCFSRLRVFICVFGRYSLDVGLGGTVGGGRVAGSFR